MHLQGVLSDWNGLDPAITIANVEGFLRAFSHLETFVELWSGVGESWIMNKFQSVIVRAHLFVICTAEEKASWKQS